MTMPVAGWIGAGVGGTGAAMGFMAQGKRERQQNRVAEDMRAETARFGQEQFDVSETLRRALEAVAHLRGETTQQYFDRRNSPERTLEGQRLEQVHTGAAQGGLEKALGAVRGPEGAYQPPGQTASAADVVTGAAAGGRSPFDQSMAVYGGHQADILGALMQQLAAGGYLSGLEGFDTSNQQKLALGLRPLDNEAFLRQLLTGVRQGEDQFAHANRMAQLGRDMEYANKVGSNEMLWGGILQNIGAGISGSGSFQAPDSQRPAEANGSLNTSTINPNDRLGNGYSMESPGALDLNGVGPGQAVA
jgi:hypothetical protein